MKHGKFQTIEAKFGTSISWRREWTIIPFHEMEKIETEPDVHIS